MDIESEYYNSSSTAANIYTKLNKKAQEINTQAGKEVISPSHIDFRPPLSKIKKRIDNMQMCLRNNMSDIALVHKFLDEYQDIVLYPKQKEHYPSDEGKSSSN